MNVSLVLGAGGPVGHAYHAGVLRALADGLGWDPREAHRVVGTSAGAQVGALMRAGMEAYDLSARVTGDPMSAAGQAIAEHWVRPLDDPKRPEGSRVYRPASSAYLKRLALRPWEARPGRLFSAFLPTGQVCMKPQVKGLRNLFGDDWPEASLWITAVCLHSGERVAFGREDAPQVCVGTAVASSGAVPSVCTPVEHGGRHFVDGGMHSATHLDLLEDTDDELVIVSSPLSMFRPMRVLLAREVRRLLAAGKRVVTFEPRDEAAKAMGLNPMDRARAPRVAEAAYSSTLRALEAPPVQRALEPAFTPGAARRPR